jgi:Flp pilus assembly protein TadD
VAAFAAIIWASCTDTSTKQVSQWQNVYDTSAKYVGMTTCRGCHEPIYQTFSRTGMGQSFGYATRAKSAADFTPEHALVYDSVLDFYYKPYWDHDSLYIKEFRLSGKDTVHERIQKIDYIIGSGQHTNSHLFSVNGYVFQAPITFYTQKKQWDLAPGFEKGANSRFGRMIELECMSCHNGYPEFERQSENKYTEVKTGIDCERCHGPGSLHVREKLAGKIVDTSKTPDYTIVNPRRLPTELQNSVCQRCHLQGIAVLNDGKTFFDFRPGMPLSQVMNVFMPEYEGARDKMIMASHVERMMKSRCYAESGKMSCITCHNPHVSVKETPLAQYTAACNQCHNPAAGHGCAAPEADRRAKADNCMVCHMPKNGSIDIPHVAVTDHYIRKHPEDDKRQAAITAFLGMVCFNNTHTDNITKARAYIEFYERYTPVNSLLDSAVRLLDKDKAAETGVQQNRDYIRILFLRQQYPEITAIVASTTPETIADAWTCYRVGEAYSGTGNAADALKWYARAVALKQYAPDFQNKLAVCLLSLGRTDEATKVFEQALAENPHHTSANTNLGFIAMQSGNTDAARRYMLKALHLDPDYPQNLINLAVLQHSEGDAAGAKKTLLHLTNKHPENNQARAMLEDLAR